jgi:hypothetical protein
LTTAAHRERERTPKRMFAPQYRRNRSRLEATTSASCRDGCCSLERETVRHARGATDSSLPQMFRQCGEGNNPSVGFMAADAFFACTHAQNAHLSTNRGEKQDERNPVPRRACGASHGRACGADALRRRAPAQVCAPSPRLLRTVAKGRVSLRRVWWAADGERYWNDTHSFLARPPRHT